MIVHYDMSQLLDANLGNPVAIRRLWDETHLVASLQGLVNRSGPRLYLRYNAEVDDFWWARITDPGFWLPPEPVEQMSSLDVLLERFRDDFKGLVVYDERVPATSNLASTIAGCDDLLCVRYDDDPASLYQDLTRKGRIPVREILIAKDGSPLFTGEGMIPGTETPSTGSAKNDAYLWLKAHYLEAGKTNPALFGYYIDAFWLKCGWSGLSANHTLTNHDYIIANRGIFLDLNVWEDESPVDEPGQRPGTDVATMRLLLDAANRQLAQKQMIHVAGYVPWRYKYTDCHENGWFAGSSHQAVPAEWTCTELLTAYNAYLDADALDLSSMANASFFAHLPLRAKYPQQRPLSVDSLRERGFLDEEGVVVPRNYYAHYVGDYDSAAWLYWNLPRLWTDETRGRLPLSWSFNPNLADRFPVGMAWTRATATENDSFVTGDSGAGYVNPRNLSEPRPYSGYPSAVALWEEHCRRHFRRWDIDTVGFIIDGNTDYMLPDAWDSYARIAPGGIVLHRSAENQGVHNGMPYIRTAGDLTRGPASEAARQIQQQLSSDRPNFLCFRSVLMPPAWYVEIEQELDGMGRGDAVLVDIRTLLQLLKIEESRRPRGEPIGAAPAVR